MIAFLPILLSAFTRGGGAQGRDQNEFAIRLAFQTVDVVHRDLGLVAAVILDAVGRNAKARGDVDDGFHGRFLGDLDV
jgi:hypothetical protein